MIPSTKEKILQATLNLIKDEGLEGVTIRKIAGLAGANVALINYYFGSKERLISETLKLQLESFMSAFTVFEETELSPLEQLKKFLLAYASSLQEHPELIKRLLGQEQQFQSQTEYTEFLKSQGYEKLSAAVTEIIGTSSKEKLQLIIQQMFAAILTPVIKASFGHKNQSISGGELRVHASIEEQIDLFLDHYFYKYTTH